ncbi:hypothetical protein I656_01577 [Geobacillus sp. WSUCF1]|nr:hypothetical protein I656_01577 [Geobacillus sp. WSUCF1]
MICFFLSAHSPLKQHVFPPHSASFLSLIMDTKSGGHTPVHRF